MSKGPQKGTLRAATPAIERARTGWGEEMPPEIRALAEACMARTAGAVAKELGVSPALVSYVLSRKYPGDIDLVFAKIRGTLMGEEADCPVLGMIPARRCLDEQIRPYAATNSIRARLFHACARCPRNRKNQKEEAGQ